MNETRQPINDCCRRCAVFYYKQSAVIKAGQMPVKLRRTEAPHDNMTNVFNYSDYSLALEDYVANRGPKPLPHCVLLFGQEQPFSGNDSTVLVAVTVTTSRALKDLKKAEAVVSTAVCLVSMRISK